MTKSHGNGVVHGFGNEPASFINNTVEIVSYKMIVAQVTPAHSSGSSTGKPDKPLTNNPSIC